jgi:hypothetical protein
MLLTFSGPSSKLLSFILLLFSTHSKVNGYSMGWIATGVLNVFWWELANKRKSSVTLAHFFG